MDSKGRRKKRSGINWLWQPTVRGLLNQSQPVKVDHEEIQLRRYIGAGEHGAVYEASLGDGMPLAVKYLKEFTTANLPRHPNVVKVIGYSFDREREHQVLLMEKLDMNLAQLIRNRRKKDMFPFLMSESIWIMYEICKGISFLDSRSMSYNNFKAQSVLVNIREGFRWEVKLSSACLNHDSTRTSTSIWKKTGVLSFARVCYQILTGTVPSKEKWTQLPAECPARLRELICSSNLDEHSTISEFDMVLSVLAMPSMTRNFGQAPVIVLRVEDLGISRSTTSKIATKMKRSLKIPRQPHPVYRNGLWVFTSQEVASFIKHGLPMFGGASSVLRGRMADGMEVVVKMFDSNDISFFKEIQIQTNHKNLLSPIGYCAEERRRFLIFRYMPKTLKAELLGEKLVLDWNGRMQIAIGIAEGLECLHKHNIVHRDVNPRRILLDFNFEARITNFTLSKILPVKVSETEEATALVGTPGYIAPECFMSGKVSLSCDVYSFGVLLIQLISGSRDPYDLPTRAANTRRSKRQEEELVDLNLGGNFNLEQLRMVTRLAIRCTHENPEDRPTMLEVVTTMKDMKSSAITPVKGSTSFPQAGYLSNHVWSMKEQSAARHIQAAWRSVSSKATSQREFSLPSIRSWSDLSDEYDLLEAH